MRVPDNILIIRLSSVGDIVLTLPVVRFLRERFPGARIDYLTKRNYAELLRWNPALSNVLLFDGDRPGELRTTREAIRAARYDLILDLHNSLRSIVLRTFVGARRVRVFRKHAVKRFLLVKFKWNRYGRVRTVAERYADTLRGFGTADVRVEMPVPEDVARIAGGILRSGAFTAADRLVGFAPTARHFTKRWPMDRYVRLGADLAAAGRVRIAIFGGPEETEECADLAHLINSAASAHCAESFAGRFSLPEAAAALGSCALLVTNDTGLMHIAAARGTPLVAIFGSSVKEFGFFPQGDRSLVVEADDVPCRPCSHIGRSSCPLGHFDCMNRIGPERVLAEALRLLRETAPTTAP